MIKATTTPLIYQPLITTPTVTFHLRYGGFQLSDEDAEQRNPINENDLNFQSD